MIELLRTYHEQGTNGVIRIKEKVICYSIELPWRLNIPSESCIPEGIYLLKKRFSKKFKNHFILEGVPNRSLILIHPANHAQRELRGCIAPVSKLVGEGKGTESRKAFNYLKTILESCLQQNKKCTITIKRKDEYIE